MFVVFQRCSRVITGMTDCEFKGIRDTGILAPAGYPFCRSFNLFKCLSQSSSHAKHCITTSLSELETMGKTEIQNDINLVRNVIGPTKFTEKINFHTNSCLNKKFEDYQSKEKRTANILLLMCITAVVGTMWLNSLLDPYEYDKPTSEKE